MERITLKERERSCVVIGSTRLCVTILERLAAQGWRILAVVSEDPVVRHYSFQRNLNLLSKLSEVEAKGFVLFSVANYLIISDVFLSTREVAIGINYHDSFLPRYAGVNSTTWAVYNNESFHGVSWHLICAGIDEGGILKQEAIPLAPDETALSLNLKCFEAAIRTFDALLEQFASDHLTPIPQDISQKTYYGKECLPDNYGLIDFHQSYQQIDRLYRSLYFGEEGFPNAVGSVKVWDGAQCYLTGPLRFVEKAGAVPGYVYSASSAQGLQVGLADGLLVIEELFTPEGERIEVENTSFCVGRAVESYRLDNVEKAFLSLIKKAESKSVRLHSSEKWTACSFFFKSLTKHELVAYQRMLLGHKEGMGVLLSKIAFVLLKLAAQPLVVPIRQLVNDSSPFLQTFIVEESSLYITPELQALTYQEFAAVIQQQVESSRAVLRDMDYRHRLKRTLHDVEIFLDSSSSYQERGALLSRLQIVVREEEVFIQGDRQDTLLIDSLADSLEYVLRELTLAPDSLLYQLCVLSPSEYQKIVFEWNKTAQTFPVEKTLCDLFGEQVSRTPEQRAIVLKSESLTFHELDEKSTRLARYLQKSYQRSFGASLPPASAITICAGRTIEMIIGMLAVMKAGAAYVPIDPDFPLERVNFILQDTNSRLLLVYGEFGHLDGIREGVECILIDEEKYGKESAEPLPQSLGADDLAYLIYTSGTTGNPKGVMIEHASAVNTLFAIEHIYDFAPLHRKTCCFTSFIFDVSVTEIFSSLLRGGELHLLDNDHKCSPELLSEYLLSREINYLYLPPAVLGLLPKKEYRSLRALIIAGEPCDQNVGAYWASRYPLYNYYGPTECAVYAIGKRVEVRNVNEIGKPVANKKAYILDAYLNPVPIGIVGELYVGGVGQARGYLNLPELSREKFIPDPFSDKKEARLYKTGDLVRLLPDGNIEYVGRNDFQVKIRGYRVELSEIERILSSHSKVRQSVVLIKEEMKKTEGGSAYHSLVAFYMADEEGIQEELLAYLEAKLPDYMVPGQLIRLSRFPTTLTGKLDRAALLNCAAVPEPAIRPLPHTEIEKEVLRLWEEVLKREGIDLDAGFFQSGGNSLLAMALQSKLRSQFAVELSILNLFQYPTIRSFSSFIAEQKREKGEPASGRASSSMPPALSGDSDAIAIIGMACRVPGARDLHQFWCNLAEGVESIENLSDATYAEESIDPHYVRRAANLDGYLRFDAEFFGYTPREAESMDPQHRHFMEVVFEALEDSGYARRAIQEEIGLYAGQGESVYYLKHIFGNKELENDLGHFQLMINNEKDFLATKISYKLNLKGPSISVQTACSTSLAAVHMAISQLRSGECSIAIAGGVSIAPRTGYRYQKGMIESSDGRCRAFDRDADGTVISSGAGVVVLKFLSRALADGDQIYAVIKGSAMNNDGGTGAKAGYTAPSVLGQARVIEGALERAGVDPATISYVEAHGTGTKIGDPIELSALHQVFSKHQLNPHSVAIGSVKSNIGHTDAAAGVVSLIKTALALQKGKIPASLHFRAWNPEIEAFNKIFYVNQTLSEWPSLEKNPRRAGVSSFGIGGTNVHAVLEEAPTLPQTPTKRKTQLCLFSAESLSSLRNYREKFYRFIKDQPELELADIAATLQLRKEHRSHRCFSVTSRLDELQSGLETLTNASHTGARQPPVFLFSGQGSQYHKMGKGLYLSEPFFAAIVNDCFKLLKESLNTDFREILFGTRSDPDRINQTEFAQPLLFIIEYALGSYLMHLGVSPAALIGHSVGEYAAAALAGIFDWKDALLLVVLRGKLMQNMPPGAMLSLHLSEELLRAQLPLDLDIAAVNGADLSVVSGESSAIKRFSSFLAEQEILHTMLHTSHAFHSRMMEPILDEFRSKVASVKKNAPLLPVISNLTGSWLTAEQALSPDYWCSHLREPVRFFKGVKTLLQEKRSSLFVEVGPGNVLTSLVKQADKEVQAVASLRHPKVEEPDDRQFLHALGRVWQSGVAIDWPLFHQHERRRVVSLPTYAFDHSRDFVPGTALESELAMPAFVEAFFVSPANSLVTKMREIWKAVLGVEKIQLEDHFFELGGHSLLAAQLVKQIEDRLTIALELRDLFQNPTLGGFCKAIEEKETGDTSLLPICMKKEVAASL